MGWVRDAAGCSSNNDGRVITCRERYLIGDGVDPIAVSIAPQNFLGGNTGSEPLPAFGSSHPSAREARLDAYSVETDGGVATVVGLYSSDQRFTVPAFGAPTTGYRWRATTVSYGFPVPWAAKTTDIHWKPVADGATGPPEPQLRYRWAYLKEQWEVKAQRIAMSLRIPDNRIVAAIDTMFMLQNTAMPINGRVWVFEGGDVDEGAGRDEYRMQFNFMREADIQIDLNNQPANTWWPDLESTYVSGGPKCIKPAYHKTVIVPPENGDVSTAPGFRAIPNFRFERDGFEALKRLVP